MYIWDPNIIRVGLTEAHGMASELSQFPPHGVRYGFVRLRPGKFSIVQSPIKNYLRHYKGNEYDLIEAVLSPVLTEARWIYSCENFQAAAAFNILGCPLPRSLRTGWIKRLLLRDNCKKVVFWSYAGKETLRSYAGITDKRLLEKVAVVYPAIRKVPDQSIQFSEQNVTMLFSGDFFRKGGVNVVDAFERAQRTYPSIKLRLCCDEQIDFNTTNADLKRNYLDKIRNTDRIILGRVGRNEMINEILPTADIYLLPTYVEAFGFAILEAMAFGIPVISTNHFAIPEMVEDGINGFLIDVARFNCEQLFRGYVVDRIPSEFREHVTNTLFEYICRLIKAPELRRQFGMAGVSIARTKFSFEIRNKRMLEIYREALQ